MSNKITFDTAHGRTRVIMTNNPNLKYRIVFAFQLKKAIAEQHKHKKVTTLHANGVATVELVNKKADAKLAKKACKKVNKKVALVGDYIKPAVKNADLALPFFMTSSLILIVFAIAFHTINLL